MKRTFQPSEIKKKKEGMDSDLECPQLKEEKCYQEEGLKEEKL